MTPGPDTPGSWTPDGKALAFGRGFPLGGSANSDIFVVSVDRPQEARPLLNTASNERYPEFSPDGKWLAYSSDETGQFELYVQPYPGTGRRVTVTSEGASEPAWSRDSNELLYRIGMRMMSVRFEIASDEFVPEKPVLLFDLPSDSARGGPSLDGVADARQEESPDGERRHDDRRADRTVLAVGNARRTAQHLDVLESSATRVWTCRGRHSRRVRPPPDALVLPRSPALSRTCCRADRARRSSSRPGVESRRSRASRAGCRAYRRPVVAQELVAHGQITVQDRTNLRRATGVE